MRVQPHYCRARYVKPLACLRSILALLVQRSLRWFGHAANRPDKELIKNLLLLTTFKADLEPLSRSKVFGYVRRRKGWLNTPTEVT